MYLLQKEPRSGFLKACYILQHYPARSFDDAVENIELAVNACKGSILARPMIGFLAKTARDGETGEILPYKTIKKWLFEEIDYYTPKTIT